MNITIHIEQTPTLGLHQKSEVNKRLFSMKGNGMSSCPYSLQDISKGSSSDSQNGNSRSMPLLRKEIIENLTRVLLMKRKRLRADVNQFVMLSVLPTSYMRNHVFSINRNYLKQTVSSHLKTMAQKTGDCAGHKYIGQQKNARSSVTTNGYINTSFDTRTYFSLLKCVNPFGV